MNITVITGENKGWPLWPALLLSLDIARQSCIMRVLDINKRGVTTMPFGKTVTVTKVEYNELEKMIKAHFPGVSPELVAREEWSNYEDHSFTVDGILDEDDTETLGNYIAGTWTQSGTTQVLLNALCLKDAIPAGEYVVSIFW